MYANRLGVGTISFHVEHHAAAVGHLCGTMESAAPFFMSAGPNPLIDPSFPSPEGLHSKNHCCSN